MCTANLETTTKIDEGVAEEDDGVHGVDEGRGHSHGETKITL